MVRKRPTLQRATRGEEEGPPLQHRAVVVDVPSKIILHRLEHDALICGLQNSSRLASVASTHHRVPVEIAGYKQSNRMIRQTLAATKRATYAIEIPVDGGLPAPRGTGFFVSGDGWFVTAAHVVIGRDGRPVSGLEDAWITQHGPFSDPYSGMCQWPTLIFHAATHDLAILKFEFERNANKEHLKGLSEFPHLKVSARLLEEGEPVYSFGYPLPEHHTETIDGVGLLGTTLHRPRTTSAIVASLVDSSGGVMADSDPEHYVLDKALNYGNSEGPIVASGTGNVHALRSRFHPVVVPQPISKSASDSSKFVWIPSLYGVTTRLSHAPLIAELQRRGLETVSD